MRLVVGTAGIGLLNQNALRRPVPDAGPSLVCPAKAEWEFGSAGMQHFVKRALQNTPSRKPVMVVTEPFNAVAAGQNSLRFAGFRHAKIIESDVCGNMRLIMPRKHRLRLRR